MTITVHLSRSFIITYFPEKDCVSLWDLIYNDVMQLTYRREAGFIEASPTTNVVLEA